MLRKGYATKPQCRENVSSGGLVTNLLCNMLRQNDIDGAWVVKAVFRDGKPTYETYIAVTEDEIRDSGTSVYMTVPMLGHIELLENFDGRVAVVMMPCMLRAFEAILEKKPYLRDKVVMKLGLYCGGCDNVKATELAIKKGLGSAQMSLGQANRMFYRRGHWRGMSAIMYADGTEQNFSYSKNYGAYKNAFFFMKSSCFLCKDHFAECADISFGDIWLKEMKKEEIKYTSCVVRTEEGVKFLKQAYDNGVISLSHISARDLILSQKRALVFKYFCQEGVPEKKWNHKLVCYLAKKNNKFAREHYGILERLPRAVIYYYMCIVRMLLNF